MTAKPTALLEEIIQRFESSRNIQEKRKIQPIIELIKAHSYRSDQIYASLGEDAAAIRLTPDSPDLVLLTTDALIPEFIEASPWAAGFAAIYVGIDDIVACGGRPIACSTTVSYREKEVGSEIFRGILDATRQFQLPLIRGHTTTDAASSSLTSTLIGHTSVERYISAGGAKIGDVIGLVFDLKGKKGRFNSQYWDTITMMDPTDFWEKRSFLMNDNAHQVIHACKDISNGGILGTLFQMLSYTKLGGKISLDALPNHPSLLKMGYSLIDFLFAYLTSSFLVAISPNMETSLKNLLSENKLEYINLGAIIAENQIQIEFNQQKKSIDLTEIVDSKLK